MLIEITEEIVPLLYFYLGVVTMGILIILMLLWLKYYEAYAIKNYFYDNREYPYREQEIINNLVFITDKFKQMSHTNIKYIKRQYNNYSRLLTKLKEKTEG